MQTTGQRIKAARLENAMTQQELSRSLAELGQWVGQSYVGLLENDEIRPSPDMIFALSLALDVSVEHLTEPMQTTGQRIKSARQTKTMTQQELSQCLASLGQWADQSYVSLLENDERRPSLDMVLALSSALDISVEYLTEPLQAKRCQHER